jgi:hypothetical protein
MNGTVPFGSANNDFAFNAKLNDSGLYGPTKFSGFQLANAYVFGNFEPIDGKPLTVKLGNHVVNWGETLFIPGISRFGVFNLAASHQPGARVKDILMPLPQISANWGVADGVSVEAFYHLGRSKSVSDGCGTYFSPSDLYNCGRADSPVMGDSVGTSADQASGKNSNGINYNITFLPDTAQKVSGQFGLATKVFSDALNTDFGLYYAVNNQNTPMLSIAKVASLDQDSVFSGNFNSSPLPPTSPQQVFTPMSLYWDYSATKIQAVAVSAATVVGGWTLNCELGYTKDIPVQLNGTDLLIGVQLGKYLAENPAQTGGQARSAGPLSYLSYLPLGSNINGYDSLDKVQLNVNTIKIVPRVAGAQSVTLVGEVAVQHWNAIGDSRDPTSRRYGRASTFGFATEDAFVCDLVNPNKANCVDGGYATATSWVYRAAAVFKYSNVFAGINLEPTVFFAHDVKGTSPEGTFVEDRMNLGLSLQANYLSKYYGKVSYSTYNSSAKYDVQRDRDNISIVLGANF